MYFQLIIQMNHLNKELNYFCNKNFEDLDITTMELYYMHLISKNPGINQYQIAKELNSSRKLIFAHIKKLSDKGYVKKVEEGRSKKLFLIKEGEYILETVYKRGSSLKDLLSEKSFIDNPEKLMEDLKKLKSFFEELNNREHFINNL